MTTPKLMTPGQGGTLNVDYTFFGTVDAGTSAAGSFAGSAISAAQVGDAIVVGYHNAFGTATPVSSSAGWLHLGPPAATSWRSTGVYVYLIDSDEALADFAAGTHTFTAAGGGRVAGIAIRAIGLDLDAIADAAASTPTVSSPIAGLTTTADDALVICLVERQAVAPNSPNLTAMSGMTDFIERKTSTLTSGSSSAVALGFVEKAPHGAVSASTLTYSATVSSIGGAMIALKAGPWSPPEPPNEGVPVKYTSAVDTLADGHLYVGDGAGELVTPDEIRAVPRGTTVADMLAGSPRIAHRGGSLDWPEMSLHAYTQAVFWGVGALEASLARTSDGVWFGLHDETLDRTSGVTGYTASALTWAQVQALSISAGLPGGQTAKPYMPMFPASYYTELGLTTAAAALTAHPVPDLVSAYGQSHTLVVDAKVAIAFAAELGTLIALTPGYEDRTVLKSYGVSGMTIPNLADTLGIPTWGYFYPADSASYVTYAPRWSILGQAYTASQTDWDNLRAAGTPGAKVWAHIIPNAAAAVTALARGADGMMVSGVMEAITRSA